MLDLIAPTPTATRGAHPVTERTVLLVEDEAPLRAIIARNLTARGYPLYAAASVEEATHVLWRHYPDVVVLDINLPDGTGWEILRWLRARDLHPAVIVYSAVPLSRKRVAELRPDAVLLKPFPMACLLDLVATVGNVEGAAERGDAAPGGDPPARRAVSEPADLYRTRMLLPPTFTRP
jgi:DNA-binding response OmpR family regulator